jgi:hypothetical protein
MWQLRDHTAYACERTWVRDAEGRHHWVVVAKATFELATDGALGLADEQLPPRHEPAYFGEPGASSLRYEADLIAPKPGTDLLVNAHAHAPGGRATAEVEVGLRAGEVDKTLLVRGPSRYQFGVTGLSVTSPEPFVSRAIRYEHAFGGRDELDPDPRHHRIDPRNPVGAGFARRPEHLHGRPAASVYYPRGDPAKLGPAGFGAIASYWSPRLELAGSYDERWAASKRPLLPDDYDPAHLLCAPRDQRPGARLRGGEIVELTNMNPAGHLRLELPTIELRATTRIARRSEEHGFELATVVIEPEEGRLIMVWQSSLLVRAPEVDELHFTEIREVSA